MRCLCCGTENNDKADVCATCGRSFANQPPPLTADGGGYNNALRAAPHVKPLYGGQGLTSLVFGMVSLAIVLYAIFAISISARSISDFAGLAEAFGVWIWLLLTQMWLIISLGLSAVGLSLGIYVRVNSKNGIKEIIINAVAFAGSVVGIALTAYWGELAIIV